MGANQAVEPETFEVPIEQQLIDRARRLIAAMERPVREDWREWFEHPPLLPDPGEAAIRVRHLVEGYRDHVGACKGCRRAFSYMRMKPKEGGPPEGKLAPYDADGNSHFAVCPQAAEYRRRGSVAEGTGLRRELPLPVKGERRGGGA